MVDCLKLKKSNCKNCYKCIRHCPVKSIRFSANQAHIVSEECILCGQCFVVCPQNAKEIVCELEKVKVAIQSGEPVIASIAPSFIANYNVGIEAVKEALLKLGFSDVEETAVGATMVKQEYDRILEEEDRNILISSCCHSITLLIQKHYPSVLPYLADVISPMQAHCQNIKQRIPNAKTVFIGPCVAKKDEGNLAKEDVDAVLTFEELTQWLEEENIEIKQEIDTMENSKARFFPVTGGILKTMAKSATKYTYLAVDGVENCIAALKDIEQGNVSNCFIEMSACVGSCIGGPVMEKFHHSPIRDYMKVTNYAGSKDFDIPQKRSIKLSRKFTYLGVQEKIPSEYELYTILKQMGKMKPEDELNCGSCGYNTCKEKAIAIYHGKADVSMCLPFLKDKAETFSDTIVKNTPNGVIVVNDNLEVQQINEAAMQIFNIQNASYVLGDTIARILDPMLFIEIEKSGRNIRNKKMFLTEYQRYIELTIVYDREYHLLVCIIRDVTKEQQAKETKENFKRQTAEIADKVVTKQMRIVQEIASLLGETTAETKIALTKLKESIQDE